MTALIKYCGNRSYSDYLLVSESKATYIGFIFVQGSKRCVSAEEVAVWVKQTPPLPTQKLVGVFVNPDLDSIIRTIKHVSLDVIQLHGTEPPEFVNEVRSVFGGEVWKAIHHREDAVELMKTYKGVADAYLIDSKITGSWGGTGQSFDWSYIPAYLEEARNQGVPCFIAGGVNPENVTALLEYKPDGIDLASGIEDQQAKSKTLIQALQRKVVQE